MIIISKRLSFGFLSYVLLDTDNSVEYGSFMNLFCPLVVMMMYCSAYTRCREVKKYTVTAGGS